MKGKALKILSLVISILILASIVTGCGAKVDQPAQKTTAVKTDAAEETKTDTTPFTFKHFWNYSWEVDTQTPIMQELTKKTGVTVEFVKTQTDDDQKLNVMIASGDLPDVITLDFKNVNVGKLTTAGQLYCINDLIDKYAPNIYNSKNMSQNNFSYHRYIDGKNYYFVNYVWNPKNLEYTDFVWPYTNASNTKIRQDVYEAIGKPDMTTPDGFFNALMSAKEKFPKLIPYYCGPVYQGWDLFNVYDFSTNSFLLGQFGLTKYDVNNEKVTSMVRNPKTLEALKFYNKLYTNGLIAPESFVDDEATAMEKMNKGKSAAASYYQGYLKQAPEDNPNTKYIDLPYFKTAKVKVNGAGWQATVITKNAKNPERIIKFFDYCMSDEGIHTISWGIEGVHWKYDENKVPMWLPEFEKLSIEDWGKFSTDTGITQYGCFTDDYESQRIVLNRATEEDKVANDMYKPYSEKDVFYGVMDPAGDTPEGIIFNKLCELSKVQVLKAVMARNESECEKIYNEFVAKCEELGLDKVEDVWTAKYKQFK